MLTLTSARGDTTADPEIRSGALADFESELPAVKDLRCVAPVEIMRRQHMQLLVHQQDRAVYEGLRNQRFSLQQCVECHAEVAEQQVGSEPDATEFQRIDAPGQFCAGCHEYVGVRIDCFSCHAAKPFSSNAAKGAVSSQLSVQAFGFEPTVTDQAYTGMSDD